MTTFFLYLGNGWVKFCDMRFARLFCLFAPLILAGLCPAQQAVDPTVRYYRMIVLVHMTGSGKANDPIRPEFVPSAIDARKAGIIAWSMQPTDDKKMAIVHIVATDRKAFDALVSDKRSEIKVFEVGKHGKDTVEQEMKKYKKDFDLSKFEVRAQ